MNRTLRLTLAAGLLLAPIAALAQNGPIMTTEKVEQHEKVRTIPQHRENQQDRIAQGIDNGSLSPAEAARLERQQASINRQQARMKAENGGHLSAYDRKVIRERQENASTRIYKVKHDEARDNAKHERHDQK